MINAWLNQIAQAIAEDFRFAPLLALFAGVLTSFTPCSLSGVPLIISYVGGGGSRDTKKAFGYSAVFAAGTAVTFLVLGLIASSAGRLLGRSSPVWYFFLGVLMVLMALQTWGIFSFIPSAGLLSANRRRGWIGAFLAGILAGIFSSPCSTPVLIALLGMIAGKGNLAWGVLLMLLYSLGHSTLVIAAGTSVGFVQKVSGSSACGKAGTVLTAVMGGLILLVGFYMFWLAF
jgi:cytochrome c-type biogenesis protein